MFHPSVTDGLTDGPMITKNRVLVDKTKNQINVIYPYKTKGGWSFDDADVGLQGEPFVAGIPEIINSIVGRRRKFTAYISKSPIPNYTGHLVRTTPPTLPVQGLEEEQEAGLTNGWYKLQGTDQVGWLCPATLKYFDGYPKSIYFRIE